jgi:hypothetical protein
MAAVLAGGGFPVEALPSLREGVELGLRSAAHLEGLAVPEAELVPLPWIESHLPQNLPLARTLRAEPEALLGARDGEVRAWIAAGERLAGEMSRGLEER